MSGAINHGLVSQVMRGRTQDDMVRRRDAAGDEMSALARIMQDPKPDAGEVTSYIRELMQKQHIPADDAHQLLATVPHDPEALRAWAQEAFSLVMHHAIHAHAAFPRELYPAQPQQPPPPAAPPAAPQQQAAAPAPPAQGQQP